MKHKVAELEGSLLDAAVAKAEGNWSADSISAIIERERITVEPVVIWTDDNEALLWARPYAPDCRHARLRGQQVRR
jgi:hypothetical protein